MNRDLRILHQILFAIEADPAESVRFPERFQNDQGYAHARLLKEAGLIETTWVDRPPNQRCIAWYRLTWAGHEAVDRLWAGEDVLIEHPGVEAASASSGEPDIRLQTAKALLSRAEADGWLVVPYPSLGPVSISDYHVAALRLCEVGWLDKVRVAPCADQHIVSYVLTASGRKSLRILQEHLEPPDNEDDNGAPRPLDE